MLQTATSSGAREPAPSDKRIAVPLAVRAHLVELIEQGVPVTLVTPDGATLSTRLVHEDMTARELRFAPLGEPCASARLALAEEAVAIAYLARIKLQFDLIGLRLRDGGGEAELSACYPRELHRFQRREAYRVRTEPPPQLAARLGKLLPIVIGGPELLLGDSGAPESLRRLRVLDISHGGVALLLPPGDTSLRAGSRIPAATLELSPGRTIHVALHVVRADPLAAPEGAQRLGCEMEGLSGVAARSLQRFIDETQIKARALDA
ncbi:flagellar brake protein [Leptothrix discophora]|uniref:Flagellar brake protein n=1 Tax=Leptothrix discophora TaxID=89 RepID=A0ABT9G6D2_LEPDI|nr:flagellar brake protein [Leptothrix discophora]MDP4302045.1 flagellar brake protein [Leptothrix discophora]